MKHGREDYNGRIVDLAALTREAVMGFWSRLRSAGVPDVPSPIAADEPVFVLRAKDKTAPDAVRHWALLQYRNGGSREAANAAMAQATAMEDWQESIGMKKMPDLPDDALPPQE